MHLTTDEPFVMNKEVQAFQRGEGGTDFNYTLFPYHTNFISITEIKEERFLNSPLTIPEEVIFPDGHTCSISIISTNALKSLQTTKVILPASIIALRGNIAPESHITFIDLSKTKITKLDNSAFEKWVNLVEIILPETLTSLPKSCFLNSLSLTNPKIPLKTNLDQADKAFSSCISLRELNLSQSNITIIPNYFFFNCISLSNLILPEIRRIGAYSFYRTCISHFELPNSVRLNTASFAQINTEQPVVKIDVTDITDACFAGCTQMKSIIIGENVKKIQIDSFKNCSSLANIEILGSLNKIMHGAFLNTSSLKFINFSNCNFGNYPYACFEMSGIENIISPPIITAIDHHAFSKTGISELIFSNLMKSIKYDAYSSCHKLKIVNLSESQVEVIEHHAFFDCFNLEKIIFPKNRGIAIGEATFQNNTKLKSLDFDDGVYFDKYSFAYCISLETVRFYYCEEIQSAAFTGCTNLSVFCPKKNSEYRLGFYFEEIYNLIGSNAFSNAVKPTFLYIGKKINILSDYCFSNMENLKIIDLHESEVTTIGYSAFSGCKKLETLYLSETITDIRDYAFSSVKRIVVIYCGNHSYYASYNSFPNSAEVVYYSKNYSNFLGNIEPMYSGICLLPQEGLPTPRPTAEPIPKIYNARTNATLRSLAKEVVIPASTPNYNLQGEYYFTPIVTVGRTKQIYFTRKSVMIILGSVALILLIAKIIYSRVFMIIDHYTQDENTLMDNNDYANEPL